MKPRSQERGFFVFRHFVTECTGRGPCDHDDLSVMGTSVASRAGCAYRWVAIVAAWLSIAQLPAWAGDTQVYKTVDAQGNVVYTDHPSSANAPKTSVRFHEPTAEDQAQAERQRKANQASEMQRVQETLASSSAQAQQQKEQKDRQTRCENARNRYNGLKDATRLYQLDAQGNRVFLPDEAADAKRAEARKAMDAACAP